MEKAEFFRQALRDFGGLVILADPQKPFMQPKVGERILKVFSQFGYTPEMFLEDINNSDNLASRRSREFLRIVNENTRHVRSEEEKMHLVMKVDNEYILVPL